ncbi:uncharacterized protein C8orf59 homolog isoform X1 [Sus scrofa]|uniref:Ribosomal biosis factor n=3 Tax=Suina TaxID=35497 RepID=A0A8W4FJJ1_PIG|nr:uncharacterized protein C8orf59 homolog isoform X1 [Sus scrofa]
MEVPRLGAETEAATAGLHHSNRGSELHLQPTPQLKTMAKNKLRGQKSRNVFHIANQKSFKVKNKAKPVTTNLKKINIVNEEKVNRLNKAFLDIQKELAHFSKGLSLEPLQKQLSPQQCPEKEPVNVDEATRLMAQL